MANLVIKHYREFPADRMESFAQKAKNAAGLIVYKKTPEELEPNDITVDVPILGAGSSTGASSGTELEVRLDSLEWPRDDMGIRFSPELISVKLLGISHKIGELLTGGVMGIEGQIVNVWTTQEVAAGWYEGGDYRTDFQAMRRTILANQVG